MKISKEDFACDNGYYVDDATLDQFAIDNNLENDDQQHTEKSNELFCKEIGAEKLSYIQGSSRNGSGEYEIIFSKEDNEKYKVGSRQVTKEYYDSRKKACDSLKKRHNLSEKQTQRIFDCYWSIERINEVHHYSTRIFFDQIFSDTK